MVGETLILLFEKNFHDHSESLFDKKKADIPIKYTDYEQTKSTNPITYLRNWVFNVSHGRCYTTFSLVHNGLG